MMEIRQRTLSLCCAFSLIAVGGCADGGTSPIGPRPPSAPLVPRTISGRLIATQDRQPVGGARLEFNQTSLISAVSAADGSFTAGPFSDGSVFVSILSPGHVTRATTIKVDGSRSDLLIDLIATNPPFSLPYYRQLARNGYESTQLARLLLWEIDLNVYIRTRTEDGNVEVPNYVLDAVANVIVNSVPELSGGRRRVLRVEYGASPGPPDPPTGLLTVSFVLDPWLIGGYHGQASYGGPNGWMRIYYQPARNAPATDTNPCVGSAVRIVEHEIMHSMGFYHTDTPSEFFTSDTSCAGSGRPERVGYHAAIAYSRSMLNADPDVDHSSQFQSTGGLARRTWAECRIY